jgi:hypothetical protein
MALVTSLFQHKVRMTFLQEIHQQQSRHLCTQIVMRSKP